MIVNNRSRILSCMSILTLLAQPLHAEWGWKDVAAAGAMAAGVGACIYAATKTEEPHVIRRKTEETYDTIAHRNRAILHARYEYEDTLIHYVHEKGRSYRCNDWFVGEFSPMSEACRKHAPLVRGHAALKAERDELKTLRKKLIEAYGSERAARYEYFNFDNLTELISTLDALAHRIKHTTAFYHAQQQFAQYQAYVEEQARRKAELARMQADVAAAQARFEAQRRAYQAQEYYYNVPNQVNYSVPENCSFNLTFYN